MPRQVRDMAKVLLSNFEQLCKEPCSPYDAHGGRCSCTSTTTR